MIDKNELQSYTIKNKYGAFAKITNLGGIIMELHIPTKEGVLRNVVLGFRGTSDYLNNDAYLGAIIGRYANRIAHGQFSLGDRKFQVSRNDNDHCIHGGIKGFDKEIWNVTSQSDSHIVFAHRSEDGSQGFPGQLDVRVKYMIDRDNQLLINYRATTDQETVLNLTNHSYFNLDGESRGSILDHHFQINADHILEVDENLIPTGKWLSVDQTPFDLRHTSSIAEMILSDHPQLQIANGYDHNYIINKWSGELLQCATVQSSDGQISMEVLTTNPGVQFYTGNNLNIDQNGRRYGPRSGFCLETQSFPDSPNHTQFPSTILSPDQVYESQTIYRFI